MIKPKYTQTDTNTANLMVLLLEKLASFELKNSELNAMLCTLTNPLDLTQLFTEEQTAARLSISTPTVYRYRKQGKLHYRQDGHTIRYSLGDIQEYEESIKR